MQLVASRTLDGTLLFCVFWLLLGERRGWGWEFLHENPWRRHKTAIWSTSPNHSQGRWDFVLQFRDWWWQKSPAGSLGIIWAGLHLSWITAARSSMQSMFMSRKVRRRMVLWSYTTSKSQSWGADPGPLWRLVLGVERCEMQVRDLQIMNSPFVLPLAYCSCSKAHLLFYSLTGNKGFHSTWWSLLQLWHWLLLLWNLVAQDSIPMRKVVFFVSGPLDRCAVQVFDR